MKNNKNRIHNLKKKKKLENFQPKLFIKDVNDHPNFKPMLNVHVEPLKDSNHKVEVEEKLILEFP